MYKMNEEALEKVKAEKQVENQNDPRTNRNTSFAYKTKRKFIRLYGLAKELQKHIYDTDLLDQPIELDQYAFFEPTPVLSEYRNKD